MLCTAKHVMLKACYVGVRTFPVGVVGYGFDPQGGL